MQEGKHQGQMLAPDVLLQLRKMPVRGGPISRVHVSPPSHVLEFFIST